MWFSKYLATGLCVCWLRGSSLAFGIPKWDSRETYTERWATKHGTAQRSYTKINILVRVMVNPGKQPRFRNGPGDAQWARGFAVGPGTGSGPGAAPGRRPAAVSATISRTEKSQAKVNLLKPFRLYPIELTRIYVLELRALHLRQVHLID